ncbi:unnamed protein product [Adineta ricciae]|uniref:Uncharacterized protein n=1 Tax=Adineta ricciae TaxID=249248 RepID=A0A814UFY4_ADIRI|nr:unnamed protein product [Adineta ricciae]
MNYILQPLNCQSKFQIRKSAQEQDFQQPVLNTSIIFDEIYLNINKNQYSDLLDLLEYTDYLNMKSKFLKYDRFNEEKASRRRWKFAYTVLLHESIRPRLASFKWENMKENLKRYKEYHEIYFKKLIHHANKSDQQQIIDLEKQIDIFNLIYIRRTAQIEYKKKKLEEKDLSWWDKLSNWWSSDSDNPEFQLNDTLVNEERNKLYDAIGYKDQQEDQIAYPNNYIDIIGSLKLNLIRINVWSFLNQNDSNLNLITTLSIKQSQVEYQRRPAKDDFMILFDCQSLKIVGINESIRPILIEKFHSNSTNFLHLEFESHPVETNVDYRIYGLSQSLIVNYHYETMNQLFRCFLPDRHHDLQGIKEAAYSIYTDIKHQTQFLLSENLKKIQDLDINFDLQSIYFIISEYQSKSQFSSSPTSPMICLDSGHLTFKGGKVNIFDIEEDYSTFVPIEIQLKKTQFLYLNQDESWKELITKSDSKAHLIKPITITLDILKSIQIDNFDIPIWKMSGEINAIECELSETRLFGLLKLIQMIPFPDSFQNNQPKEEKERKKIESTKKKYETVEDMTPVKKILHEEQQDLEKQIEINENHSQKQRKQLQFHFLLSKINVKIRRCLLEMSDLTEDFLCLSLETIEVEAMMKTYDIQLNFSLEDFQIIHYEFETKINEKLNLFSRKTNSKLLIIRCLLTSNSNPLFASEPYFSIENQISIEINPLQIYFHLQAFSSMISFQNQLQHKLSQIPKRKPMNSSSTTTSSSSNQNKSSFEIHFHIKQICLLIGSESIHLIYFELKEFQGKFSKTNVKMLLNLTLNDLRLIDLFDKSRYQFILSKENLEKNLLEIDLSIFNSANKSIKSFTKHQSYFKGFIQKLNFIFLYKYLQLIQSLSNVFQSEGKEETINEESSDEPNEIFQILNKYQKHSIKFDADFVFHAPNVLIPRNSYSNQGICIDLGKFSMKTDSNGKSNEQYRILFENFSISRFCVNDENLFTNQIELFQCSTFQTLIQRNFNENNEIVIKIQWDHLQFHFDKNDFGTIQCILNENFKEKIFFQFPTLESYSENEDQLPIVVETPKRQIKEKETSPKLKLIFEMKEIGLILYSTETNIENSTRDENSKFLSFSMKFIEMNIEYFSNSNLNGLCQIQQMTLDDFQNKSISRLIDKSLNSNEKQSLLNIEIQFNQTNHLIKSQMESFYICITPDLLNSIKDFLNYNLPLKQNPRRTQNPIVLDVPLPAKHCPGRLTIKSAEKQKKKSIITSQVSKTSSSIEMIIEFELKPSEIILLEDQNKSDSDCLVLKLDLSMRMINVNDQTKLAAQIKDLSFFGTNFQDLKQSKIRYTVLSQTQINLIMLMRTNEQKIDLNLSDLSISIDPTLIKTFVTLANSIQTIDKKPKEDKEKINSKTIFIPKPFKDSSFWFIQDSEEKEEILDETDLLQVTTGTTSEKTKQIQEKEKQKQIEKNENLSQELIINLNIIEVKLELGKGSSTRPVVALCLSNIFAQIHNWSTDLLVSASVQWELALFNDHILAWEPLIEPIIDDKGIIQSPWTISCETHQDLKDENEVENRYLLEDEKDSNVKENRNESEMKKLISIRAEYLLNVTLTKTTLDLFQRISTMFNELYEKNLPSDIDEQQTMLIIQNQTGFDITIYDIRGIQFQKDKEPVDKLIHLKQNQSIELTVPEERLSATHLPAIAEQVSKRKQEFQVKFGEIDVLVDINQTWRRVYDYSESLVPSWPIQLLCDSQIYEERRRIVLSSIIKISNRTQMPLILLDADSIEKNQLNSITKIDVNQEYYLPIQILYQRVTPRLYFTIDQGDSANGFNDFISFDWANESSSDRIVKLKDGRQAHYVVYKEEIEAYSENTDEPNRKTFHIYVKLALHLLNLLPIPIVCSIDNVEQCELKPSELYHSIQGHKKSNLIFKIPSYNQSSWISEAINLNEKGHGIHNEFIVKFTNLSTGDDLRMILRVDTYRQSYRASFYSPYWIINGTDLKFQFKIDNEKSFVDVVDQPYFICPKKYHSESNKKKGHIRLFSIEDDESISQWSEAFSLDVIKSTGMATCSVKNDRDYLICIDIVTSSFGMTKIITLIPSTAIVNNSSSQIQIAEYSKENLQWKSIESKEMISYWPRFIEEGLMFVRYESNERGSLVSIKDKHRTLLHMNDEERPALHVEVVSTDFDGFRIIFGDYQNGDAAVLIVNTLLNQPISFQQKDHLQTQVLPAQYYVYYTWNDPFKPKQLDISIGQFTATLELNPMCGSLGKEENEKIYYATFHDGPQTVLIFSIDQSVIESVSDMPSLSEKMKDYIEISFHSIGLSIIDDINRTDLFYVTINPTKEIWTEKRKISSQPLSIKLNEHLDQHYKTFSKSNQQTENQFEIEKNRYVTFNDDESAEITDDEGHRVIVHRECLPGVWFGYSWSFSNMAIHLKVNHIQIDNQLQIAMFPTILYPIVSKAAGNDIPGKPFVELSVLKSESTRSNTIHIKYFKLLIQEFAIAADQGLIMALIQFVKPEKNEAAPTVNMESDLKRIERPLAILSNEGTDNTSQETKIYFNDLHLSPLKIHVSFSMRGSKADQLLLAEYPLADFLLQLFNLAEVQDVILKLNYYEKKDDRYSVTKLTKEITSHYQNQFLKQLHVVVLGLDVLGNPFGLIRGVAGGVESFFYEPYKGAMEGPVEFLEGIATGTKYFVGSVIGGAAGALSKVTEATSKGLATATLDKDYQNARIQRKEIQAEVQPEIVSSGKNALKDVIKGVKGVVKKPIKGAKQGGAQGFMKGLGKGFLGLVGRPASGVADLTSTSFKLIKKVATHEIIIHRIRHPRHIGRDGIVRPSIAHETLGKFIYDKFDESLHGENEGYIAHIESSITPPSLLFATTKQVIFLVEDPSSEGIFKVEWTLNYKDVKGDPTVKFNPNYIEFIIKETNAIGITKKDIIHARVIPYQTVAEARFIVDKIIETTKALEI